MATHRFSLVLQQLRRIVRPATPADTDRQLLDRFVAVHDEAAFESLVQRHGPMVLGVCRRLLGDEHDADDAFQATFLVMVRKAGSIPWQDAVGGWLYQVAYRIALKARGVAARRRATEKQGLAMTPADLRTPADGDSAELHGVLDEELNRLPAKYRSPLVLCYLQGKSHEEAAHELGWPRGSMAKRLTRGQELLRQRLSSRGLALSAAMLAALTESASAALVDSTLKAAMLFAAGEAAAGASTPATALAEGVLRSMFLSKLKVAAAMAVLIGMLGIGFGALLRAHAEPEKSPEPRSGLPTTNADLVKAKADRVELVKGNNRFAFDLYGKLRAQEGNLFVSPFSISGALAMTYNGADGTTAEEMAKTLHFSLGQDRLHPAFGALTQELNGAGRKRSYQLSVANALWTQKDYGFRDEFIQSTRAHYGAAPFEVDSFGNEKVTEAINAWVEQQTQGKIKELFKAGSLSSIDTVRLVLANAIYFKGDWLHKFNKEATKDGPFQVTTTQRVTVPLMRQEESFKYGTTGVCEVLELPYAGKELSMIVLLPRRADGLADLEQALTADRLAEWLAQTREQEIEVTLPRFRVTAEFNLKPTLTDMGMPSAFSSADFSRMSPKRLVIAAAVHKAFVEVNEEGTEAAAATGIAAADSLPPRFCADHRFVFLIRDNRSGSVLFIGRLVDPSVK